MLKRLGEAQVSSAPAGAQLAVLLFCFSQQWCACVQVSPSDTKVDEECSPDELAKERARLTAELADAKKKFMAVAKRKQQEYTKKVNASPISTVKALQDWSS